MERKIGIALQLNEYNILQDNDKIKKRDSTYFSSIRISKIILETESYAKVKNEISYFIFSNIEVIK